MNLSEPIHPKTAKAPPGTTPLRKPGWMGGDPQLQPGKDADGMPFPQVGYPRSENGRLGFAFGLVIFLVVPCAAATFDERLIAAVLMAEARGEGIAGMTAVGEVIANRAYLRRKTPGLVVQEPHQFSPLNRATPRDLILRYAKMPLYPEALRIANTVIHTPAQLPGLARGADHFEHIQAPTPYWARGRKPVAVIGNLRFWLLGNLRTPDEKQRAK